MKTIPKYQACHICGEYVKLKITFHYLNEVIMRQSVRRCSTCGAFSEELSVDRKEKKEGMLSYKNCKTA